LSFFLAGNVNMVLPVVWLWEMVDEFLYQFQSFCQYSVKLQQKSAEEIANLKQCKVGRVNARGGGGGGTREVGGGQERVRRGRKEREGGPSTPSLILRIPWVLLGTCHHALAIMLGT
jgi:hypothetical protein